MFGFGVCLSGWLACCILNRERKWYVVGVKSVWEEKREKERSKRNGGGREWEGGREGEFNIYFSVS